MANERVDVFYVNIAKFYYFFNDTDLNKLAKHVVSIDLKEISKKVNLLQPIGQTKYFGQVKVVQQKDHPAPRKEHLEVNKGKNDNTKSN